MLVEKVEPIVSDKMLILPKTRQRLPPPSKTQFLHQPATDGYWWAAAYRHYHPQTQHKLFLVSGTYRACSPLVANTSTALSSPAHKKYLLRWKANVKGHRDCLLPCHCVAFAGGKFLRAPLASSPVHTSPVFFCYVVLNVNNKTLCNASPGTLIGLHSMDGCASSSSSTSIQSSGGGAWDSLPANGELVLKIYWMSLVFNNNNHLIGFNEMPRSGWNVFNKAWVGGSGTF